MAVASKHANIIPKDGASRPNFQWRFCPQRALQQWYTVHSALINSGCCIEKLYSRVWQAEQNLLFNILASFVKNKIKNMIFTTLAISLIMCANRVTLAAVALGKAQEHPSKFFFFVGHLSAVHVFLSWFYPNFIQILSKFHPDFMLIFEKNVDKFMIKFG